MKKLLLTPLLAILTGCVSYYYPYGEPQAGVRYVPAEQYVEKVYYEDEVIDEYDYSDIYVSSPYYPWWSIDYFYLGSHRHHNSFSVGFSYGSPNYWNSHYSYYDPFFPSYRYSPWSYHYSPFRFSAWYSPFYDRPYRYFGGPHYFWRNRYDRHHGSRHGDRDRYAGNNRGRHGDNRSTLAPSRRYDRLRDEDRFANDDRGRNERKRRGEDGPVGDGRNPGRRGPGTDGLQRHTTVAGGTDAGQRGMEIRSREDRKPKPSRMEPVTAYRPPAAGKPVVKLSPSGDGQAEPGRQRVSGKAGSGKAGKEYRKPGSYRISNEGNAKVPSTPYRDSSAEPVARSISSSRRGVTTVRAPAERKPNATRIQPTRPDVSAPSQRSPVVTYRPPASDKRSGRVINSRKPIASMGSIPSRPAPVSQARPPVAGGQHSPTPRAVVRPEPRPAPSIQRQKARPAYQAPSRPQSGSSSPAASRPAAKPEPSRPAKAAARPGSKGGNSRGSKRRER